MLCSMIRYSVMIRGDGFPELAMPIVKSVGPWKASSSVTRPMFFLYIGGTLLSVEMYLSRTLVTSAKALRQCQYQ